MTQQPIVSAFSLILSLPARKALVREKNNAALIAPGLLTACAFSILRA
jgi:hypothetical protein